MKAVQWTVFIDMLGFSELNSKVVSDVMARGLIEFMNTNKEILSAYEKFVRPAYKDNKQFNLYSWYDVKAAFISDSIVVTFKPKEMVGKWPQDQVLMHSANALILISMRLATLMQKCLDERKIIFRGGISNGYCDIDGSFAVGLGLSAAHEAEAKKAIYPRLVLADDVVSNRVLIRKIKWLFKKMYGDSDFVICEDGITYISVLNMMIVSGDPRAPSAAWQLSNRVVRDTLMSAREKNQIFLSQQKSLIQESIGIFYSRYRSEYTNTNQRHLNRKILKKYFWLRRHHNKTIQARGYDDYLI